MSIKPAVVKNAQILAGLTTVVLIVLGIVQIILGEFVSSSVALTANGIDCIGDGFVSAIVWTGLKFFRKPADKKFHYGYYKIENLASITAAIVMLLLAAYIIYRSYLQFTSPHEIKAPLVGAIIALFAALFSWTLGVKKYLEAKKSNLNSVKLDALNTIKDGTASFLAVIALVLSSYGYPIADALIGFVIALIIVSIAFATLKESSFILVDACDSQCIDKSRFIKNMAEDINGVKEARVIRLRQTGPVTQGEIEIRVAGDMTVSELEKIRKKIERTAKSRFPEIESLTVTANPSSEV
jgi:cation diffusion facilitator family transporter